MKRNIKKAGMYSRIDGINGTCGGAKRYFDGRPKGSESC
jgi:hypothetical protein